MSGELNHAERPLMGELFKLGQQISSLAFRAMGTDTEAVEPISADEEFQLGVRMAELGAVLQKAVTGSSLVDTNDLEINLDPSHSMHNYTSRREQAAADWRRVARLAYLLTVILPDRTPHDVDIEALQMAMNRAVEHTKGLAC